MHKMLYNVTVRIGHDKHDEWLRWMLTRHIPDVMDTGHFSSYRIHKMLGDEAPDGITYAIGYVAHDAEHLNTYQQDKAPLLQAQHQQRFGGHYGAFRSVMQIIQEG